MSNKPHTVATLLAKCVEEGDCLLWQGRTTRQGVPCCKFEGRNCGVRRALWQLLGRRTLHPGQVVSTRCGNPLCCNPEHLLATTAADLMRRRNRQAKGEMLRVARMTATIRSRARLDLDQANQIRASDRPSAELAREVGVSTSMINSIRRGARWRAGSPMGALISLMR